MAANYRQAVQWIADNDASGDEDPPEALAKYLTVCLVADIWGKTPERVAKDVYEQRGQDFAQEPKDRDRTLGMLIKVRVTEANESDPVPRARVYFVDGPVSAEHARSYGLMVASLIRDDDGVHRWKLALRGRPHAPSDTVTFYESMPWDTCVSIPEPITKGLPMVAP